MIKLYKLLLYLYPDHDRRTFGSEMVSVFQQAEAPTRGKTVTYRSAFYIREYSGLLRDVFRQQTQTVGRSHEPWLWSLEAPLAALILYGFCIWRAEEMGVWGFFFPGTYFLAAVLGGLAAWLVGREGAILRSWHRWRRALAVFVIFGALLPVAVSATEEAWERVLLQRDAAFSFHLPGIQVLVEEKTADPTPTLGLTFSRVLMRPDGRAMIMLHHTSRNSPPYLFCGGLLVAALAFWSRRTFNQQFNTDSAKGAS